MKAFLFCALFSISFCAYAQTTYAVIGALEKPECFPGGKNPELEADQ